MVKGASVWFWVSMLLTTGVACKRMEESGNSKEQNAVHQVSKSAALQKPLPVASQEPVAPGQVRAVLSVQKVFPELDTAGSGPCSQVPCRVEAQVGQVVGYGSGVNSPLPGGGRIFLYFPMTVRAGEGSSEVKAGTKLEADLQAPLSEGAPYTVRRYRILH
ncbi:hypothetical protein FHS90_004518 [Rufibacter quisquiliarum]|uniref:Lipoprotein n=1 Tax=Rufibacter quisquiliarum TaxID=1549639 RepID=A0A839GY81_9BACT|nr:hypothetical protein [Rufibacter quisquiliarum]